MIAKTFSATVLGIDAYLIEVEVDVSVGMSVFNIVGLPDGTIQGKSGSDPVCSQQFRIQFPCPESSGKSCTGSFA